MQLTFEQIASAVNGIVRTEQNELGLELHRFTREQEGFFYKTHPAYCHESFFNGYFGKNCRTCAGVTLDFISNATAVEIKFGATEYSTSSSDKEHSLDLYVNGEFKDSYKAGNDIVYNATGEKQRFTLYFPYFAFPIISKVNLKDATVFLPQKKQVDILFSGDSITHGVSARNPSNTYVMRVARNLEVGILNQGNSGFIYDKGSIEKTCDPKIIVTAYGINDFMRKNLESLKTDTTEFLIKLRETHKNSKIVSILPLWTIWDGEDENFKAEEKACLKGIYKKYSDYVIDGHNLVPHDKKYFNDKVHPNDEGFACYGDNLTKELEKILAEI